MTTLNKKLLCITFPLMVAAGCKKSYLEPNAPSLYLPDKTYTTPDALQDALVACERNLRYEWYGDGAPIISQMIFSDAAVDGVTDKSGPAQDLNIDITPDAPNNDADHNRIGWFWDQSYLRIKYANTVLTYIDVPKWDTTNANDKAKRNALIGAAYFFRAYSYYSLVNNFGDVPTAMIVYSSPKLDFQTVKRETILQRMKTDLEFAAQWVPDNVPKGEVTKGAVLHLLTKVNLSLGLFNDAIASSTQLINSGAYHLMTNRFGGEKNDATKNVVYDLHRPANKTLPENGEGLMYVIDLDGFKNNGDYDGGMSSMRQGAPNFYTNINTPDGKKGTSDATKIEFDMATLYGRGIGRCRGTWYSTHAIWTDTTDYRHAKGTWFRMEDYVYNATALKGVSPYYGKHLQKYNDAGGLLCADTIRCWFDWPYYKLYVKDNENATPSGGHTPWYVYRLAETYLLRAEAYYWAGNAAAAAADINVVRARANAQPITGTVDIGTILDERDRELFYEEPRHEEMVRMAYLFASTGKAAYNGKTYTLQNFSKDNFWYDRIMEKTDFYNKGVKTNHGDLYTMSPYHVLWPVPQYAIDANTQKQINQNEGYNGFSKNIPALTAIPDK
ncbi:RagB/SusD family nutrient uptake outer membrane protein [Deminuibacter soli]|uniref:RagB/SusD family nutrient uptake outer membrane protein n=1 Tax=Deminuibacter soli TaxID=2291815 RepID=A0A3E1NHR3_9BACT|nr:RagB/SusD family nutrient uptake outer membrane protein [Deminuibacter soli]RFM27490.1 RagB/SusD family nutrient uptake outer membrane protein [Deminuibacter soli]